jgi:predicted ArsR family transcriptional regulator
MTLSGLTDPVWSQRATGSRGRVLAAVRAAAEPLGVREVAAATGLHVNTARFHLEGLATAGMLDRVEQSRPTPGRPPIGYTARATGAPGARSYRMLSEMLTRTLAEVPDGAAAVRRTGAQWGAALVADADPTQPATQTLLELLGSIGFEPTVRRRRGGVDVELGHCPFVEVAGRSPDVVCQLHGALISGALEALDSDLRLADLEPFASPDLCVARLRRRTD